MLHFPQHWNRCVCVRFTSSAAALQLLSTDISHIIKDFPLRNITDKHETARRRATSPEGHTTLAYSGAPPARGTGFQRELFSAEVLWGVGGGRTGIKRRKFWGFACSAQLYLRNPQRAKELFADERPHAGQDSGSKHHLLRWGVSTLLTHFTTENHQTVNEWGTCTRQDINDTRQYVCKHEIPNSSRCAPHN